MTPASEAQLSRMLTAFVQAPEVDRFDVGALDHTKDRMSLRDDWTRSQVWRARNWLALRNASGSSIYVRPTLAIEAHPWVLVDNLTPESLEELRKHHSPAIVVETSRRRFQTWIRIQAAVPVELRTSIARTFARCYGGDHDGADGRQFGRMPGTTNREPDRRLCDGRAPFAALRHAGREIAMVDIPTRLAPRAVPGELPTPHEAGPLPRPESAGLGRSRRDYAVAARLMELSRSDEEVGSVLRALRNDSMPDWGDYIERTIRAARRHIERGTRPDGE